MWREACNALTGKRTSETPEEVALRRRPGPVDEDAEGVFELPLTALRAWLKQKPREETTRDYERWRRRANKGRALGDRYPAVTAAFQALVLPWDAAVEVARPDTKLDLASAQQRFREQLKASSGPLGLCSAVGVALTHGVPRWEAHGWADRGTLPPPVAVLMGSRVWRWTDIEAHAVNKNLVFEYSEGELQDELMDYHELAVLLQGPLTLKQSKGRISNAVQKGRPTVPSPAGWFSPDGRYWLREDVEQWVAAHPELVGASPEALHQLAWGQRKRVAKRAARTM